MKLSQESLQTIKEFKEDPSNQRSQYALGMLYWNTLMERVLETVREGGDLESFLVEESDFINRGLIPQLHENFEEVRGSFPEPEQEYPHLAVQQVSDWLRETIARITAGDQIEFLRRDITIATADILRYTSEIKSLQAGRKDTFTRELPGDSNTRKQIDNLVDYDELIYRNAKSKKAISKGVYFSVEDRRNFVSREKQLQDEKARADGLINRVEDDKARGELRIMANKIGELFGTIIDTEDTIEGLQKQVEQLQEKQNAISPAEMESRARREIEYLRDLVKLTARRLRIQSCPILRPGEKHFTQVELRECLDRVLEFDPRVMSNERVPMFGKPSVLLVPGNGNALFDWKYNRLIVPLVPPGGNFMGSIASAFIEYRLDVDSDKKLLNSYNKLPDMKNVRSLFQIKGKLAKDYIIWMTSEYKGFKVLPKEKRQWFEQEIAPKKQEIYCPPELMQAALSSEEFRTLRTEVDSRIGDNLGEAQSEDLWKGCILNFQHGEYERAYSYIEALAKREPDDPFVYYNLGHLGMKVSRKQEAIQAFNEFVKRRSQSWWTSVARDHLRRLQMT